MIVYYRLSTSCGFSHAHHKGTIKKNIFKKDVEIKNV